MKHGQDLRRRAKILAALGDPTRLQIAELLASKPGLTGTEIAQHVSISIALFCHHGKIMVDAGLIKKKKRGQTTYAWLNRSILASALKNLWL